MNESMQKSSHLSLEKALALNKMEKKAFFKDASSKTHSLTESFQSILDDRSAYVDAFNGVDERKSLLLGMSENVGLDLSKAQAISALSAGTADLSLIPIYVDPRIVDVTRRLTPMQELIPRVTNYGRTAEYNQLTARGITGWKGEDAALAEQDDTYVRGSKTIRFAYQVGRVTGPFLAASKQYLSQNYVDGLNLEIRNKTMSLNYVEEDSLLNGNSAGRSSAYGGITYAANLEPDGIRNLITTNTTNNSSAAPSIANIRTLIRNARMAGASTTLGQGDPNLLVTDFATKDNVKSLLQAYMRYTNENYEMPWGLKALEFDGLPMLPTKFMPTTTGSREILALQTDTFQQRVLQDTTYEELAKTNDSVKFMVKKYLTTICTAEQFNARGYGYA